ncbi:MAG: histidine phosphatase family protein [Actinobacteria bacterium]|nr:histidine phosphatase family protein [Actinomycetota bacterium]
MSAARNIMFVRHPETEANIEGRYIGRIDSPLSARGKRQTAWLEKIVRVWGADAVYASPLGRALEPARGIAPQGVDVTVLDDLAEIDFGMAEGLTFDEIIAAGIEIDYTGGGPIAPDGESGKEFDMRVGRAAASIAAGPERSVVVTHGGVVRRLLVHFLELPVETSWRFGMPNAAVAVLRLHDGGAVLESLTPPPDLSDDRA